VSSSAGELIFFFNRTKQIVYHSFKLCLLLPNTGLDFLRKSNEGSGKVPVLIPVFFISAPSPDFKGGG